MKRFAVLVASRLSYANVVSTLCLVLVVAGGTAFAATQLDKNSVRSKHIANGQVKGSDVKEDSLGQVPSAETVGGLTPKTFARTGTVSSLTAPSTWPTVLSLGSLRLGYACDANTGGAAVLVARTTVDGADIMLASQIGSSADTTAEFPFDTGEILQMPALATGTAVYSAPGGRVISFTYMAGTCTDGVTGTALGR